MTESTPIFRSLTRDILFVGGERVPAGLVVGAGILMGVMAWEFWSVLCLIMSVLLLTVGVATLRAIAKRDPKMFAVYQRYLGYHSYYPAHSTPFR